MITAAHGHYAIAGLQLIRQSFVECAASLERSGLLK